MIQDVTKQQTFGGRNDEKIWDGMFRPKIKFIFAD